VNTNTTTTLRMNGYAVRDGALLCNRDVGEYGRYLHELCGAIRFDLSVDTREGRALVESLIATVDEPRCAVGRHRNGSAIVLGRAQQNIIPQMQVTVPDAARKGVFELLIAGIALTITANVDQLVDVSGWVWGERSPLNTPREALGMLRNSHSSAVIDAAFKAGASWAPTAREIAEAAARDARLAEIKRKIASGELKLNLSAEQQQAIDDEALVTANVGKDIGKDDGVFARMILDARARVARRNNPSASQHRMTGAA
jgi:hypothetical protein